MNLWQIIALSVYVLLTLRVLVVWVKYCRKAPDFALNPTTIIGSWVDWTLNRYMYNEDSDYPGIDLMLMVLPVTVPMYEGFKLCLDTVKYFRRRRAVVVATTDDLHWSRIDDRNDVR